MALSVPRSGDKGASSLLGQGWSLSCGRFISSFQGTKEGQSVLFTLAVS